MKRFFLRILSGTFVFYAPMVAVSSQNEECELIQDVSNLVIGDEITEERELATVEENTSEAEWAVLHPYLIRAFNKEYFDSDFINSKLKPLLMSVPQNERFLLLEELSQHTNVYVPDYRILVIGENNASLIGDRKEELYKQTELVVSSLIKVKFVERRDFFTRALSLLRENEFVAMNITSQGIPLTLKSIVLSPPHLIQSLQNIYNILGMDVFKMHVLEMLKHFGTQTYLRIFLDKTQNYTLKQHMKLAICAKILSLFNDHQDLVMLNLLDHTSDTDIVIKTARALLFMRGENHKVWSFVIKTPVAHSVSLYDLPEFMQGANPYKVSNIPIIRDHQNIGELLSVHFKNEFETLSSSILVSEFYYDLFVWNNELSSKKNINIDPSEMIYFVKMMTMPIYNSEGAFVTPSIYDPFNSVIETLKKEGKLQGDDFFVDDYISQLSSRDEFWKQEANEMNNIHAGF